VLPGFSTGASKADFPLERCCNANARQLLSMTPHGRVDKIQPIWLSHYTGRLRISNDFRSAVMNIEHDRRRHPDNFT
jgi:hypothetical protein